MGIAAPNGKSCADWLAGEYPSGPIAEQVAARLVREIGLPPDKVDVIDPQDPMVGRVRDADNGCISRRLLGRHLGFMLLGALAGFVASLLPLQGESTLALYHLVMIAGATILGASVGLVLGGLRVARSGSDGMMARARQAQQLHQWLVIARVADAKQQARVAGILSQRESKGA